jgi:hypothetical protein
MAQASKTTTQFLLDLAKTAASRRDRSRVLDGDICGQGLAMAATRNVLTDWSLLMRTLLRHRATWLAIAASLLIGGYAYATQCIPPQESLTLELVSVTEDGAPVSDRSAYSGRQFMLYPDFGSLTFEISSSGGANSLYEQYVR